MFRYNVLSFWQNYAKPGESGPNNSSFKMLIINLRHLAKCYTIPVYIDIFVNMSNVFSRNIRNLAVEKLSTEDLAVTTEDM